MVCTEVSGDDVVVREPVDVTTLVVGVAVGAWEVVISTTAVGDGVDAEVLVADSTVDDGEALLVWEDVIGEPAVPSAVVDDVAEIVVVTAFVDVSTVIVGADVPL